MHIRRYRPTDTEALASLFETAAREIGSRAYTPAQVFAWTQHAADREEFGRGLSDPNDFCLVIEEDNQIVAFSQLCASGHISYLYTNPKYARRGYASTLLRALEFEAKRRGMIQIFTEASLIGRFAFRKNGFQMIELEEVDRDGVKLQRFRMAKLLVKPRVMQRAPAPAVQTEKADLPPQRQEAIASTAAAA